MKKTIKIDIDKLYIERKANQLLNYATLSHLYTPLIGNKSISAYLWLNTEANFIISENLSSSLSRLAEYLQVSKQNLLKKIFRNLEGVFLLKTYLDMENDNYLCHILPPLGIKEFMDNTYLFTLLKTKLPSKYWERTIALFKKEYFVPKDVVNVSCNFKFFYESEIQKMFKNKKEIETTSEFDRDLILARLSSSNQENIVFTPNIKKKIVFLTKLYSYHIGDVVEIIKYCKKKYNKLTVATISKAFADIYEKKVVEKPDSFFEINNFKTTLSTLTPTDFIISHEDRQPSNEEIELFKILVTKYKFSSYIINILLHFSLIKNRTIVPNYILKISQTLNKLNFTTPKDVLKHLRKAYNKSNTIKKPLSLKKKQIENLQLENKEWDYLTSSLLGKKKK